MKKQWGDQRLTLNLVNEMMQGTCEPFLSFLPKKRTEMRHPSFKWLGFTLHLVMIVVIDVIAIPWWTDTRIDKSIASLANNGFFEDDLTGGMPTWALSYIGCVFFCCSGLTFTSLFIWRCEDEPAIVQKYGDHSNDFKKNSTASDNPLARDFDLFDVQEADGLTVDDSHYDAPKRRLNLVQVQVRAFVAHSSRALFLIFGLFRSFSDMELELP